MSDDYLTPAWYGRRLAEEQADLYSRNGDEPEPPPHPADTILEAPRVSDDRWEWIDWSSVDDDDGEVIDGLVYAGRWLSVNAGAKAGKTTLLTYVGIELSLGRHPFDGTELPSGPMVVAHLDAEIGRLDLGAVVRDCGHDAGALERWHATDRPGLLSTPDGASTALRHIADRGARVVTIDGINGTVVGAEKDDTPWRDLFDLFVRPLKSDGVAIITTDNTGHDATSRPRGSSVKLDKPDAVAMLSRTDSGVMVRVPWRRSSVYREAVILAATGFDGSHPVRYRYSAGASLAGTAEVAALLDALGLPVDAGRPACRVALGLAAEDAESHGGDPSPYRVRNDLLASALRFRRVGTVAGDSAKRGSGT